MRLILTFLFIASIILNNNSLIASGDDTKEKQFLIETIGEMSASNLYASFMTITLMKELIPSEKDSSKIKDFISILESLKTQISSNITRMDEFKTVVKINKEDVDFLNEIIEINDAFLNNINLLKDYLLKKNSSSFEKFNENNKELFEKMIKLFKSFNK